ncbi:MAG: GNAT family N-acetyltransferase [Prevotellaceae bacterium]|jgi:RimJ/RimL family protein N-acetyltransferase|nr:GNAT family N-acetyltransferase [Prevotellaceae bacterium]
MEFKLRKFTESDAESLAKHANNINIAKWLTNMFPNPYTLENAKDFIASVANDNPTKVFAIEINGEAAGAIGITLQTDIFLKNAELGYWLSEEYWGNGIVPRAIKETVEYGFKTFDITRIFARPFSTNLRSQRVLQKSGFLLEAQLSKTIFKNGEYFDEMIYAVLVVSRKL